MTDIPDLSGSATQNIGGEPGAAFKRKPWSNPVLEDADVNAITEGSGTSGVEGPAFLKAGS